MEKSELKPAGVFHFFNEICQVPRPSKKEEKIVAYLKAFGEKYNLETKVDEVGNVPIEKPATPGRENLKTVILQSHVDMVYGENNDTEYNFLTGPIKAEIDGEWMKAKGATLGADNGIGVATELAILADDSIEYGPLECLFIVDRETGLTDAFALKEGFMNGEILLNLDSEDEGELFIGCAGSIDSVAQFKYGTVMTPISRLCFRITVKGLKGGHSGGGIRLGRGNANRILNRFLYLIQNTYQEDFFLFEFNGGNLRNAIPREASAVFSIPEHYKHDVRTALNVFTAETEDELHKIEPDLSILLETEPHRDWAINPSTTYRLIISLYACPHGVYAMNHDIPGLVETSTSPASVKTKSESTTRIETSQRSSVLSSCDDVVNTIRAVFTLAGAQVIWGDGYPRWKPDPDSEILKVAEESYKRLFGVDAKVKAIHAGLERGLFLDKYPVSDMISFSPILTGVRSPDERMHIPSVDKFWGHSLDVLAHIPVRN